MATFYRFDQPGIVPHPNLVQVACHRPGLQQIRCTGVNHLKQRVNFLFLWGQPSAPFLRAQYNRHAVVNFLDKGICTGRDDVAAYYGFIRRGMHGTRTANRLRRGQRGLRPSAHRNEAGGRDASFAASLPPVTPHPFPCRVLPETHRFYKIMPHIFPWKTYLSMNTTHMSSLAGAYPSATWVALVHQTTGIGASVTIGRKTTIADGNGALFLLPPNFKRPLRKYTSPFAQ